MIKPDAKIMENESGRTFRVELGRMEKEPISNENSIELKDVSVNEPILEKNTD